MYISIDLGRFGTDMIYDGNGLYIATGLCE
jgi:hypothetical protein